MIVVWFVLAAWLVVGSLVFASRDPGAFVVFFWGVVTVVLWPVALAVHRRRGAFGTGSAHLSVRPSPSGASDARPGGSVNSR